MNDNDKMIETGIEPDDGEAAGELDDGAEAVGELDDGTEAVGELDDPIVLRQKRRRRNRIIGIAALAVVLVAVAVLQLLGNGAANRQSGAEIEEKVVSGTVETGAISKTLNTYGTLASANEEDVSVPGDIRVTSYHVSAGDSVKKGDIIATVDRNTVLAAIADVQGLIDDIDVEIEELKDSSASSTLTASAAGTVVKVYAEPGEAVIDVMYDHGALMLVSLDGLYAVQVDNTGTLRIGNGVTITGSDGAEHDGRIAAIEKDAVTVTVPLSGLSFGEKVTVRDSSGTKLGAGKLALFSQQKITGYSGTVSSVDVGEGGEVAEGDTLITLSDTDYTADYQVLLKDRKKLVAQANKLAQISKTGYVYAEEDGVISSVNEDVLQESADSQNAEQAGYTVLATKAAPAANSAAAGGGSAGGSTSGAAGGAAGGATSGAATSGATNGATTHDSASGKKSRTATQDDGASEGDKRDDAGSEGSSSTSEQPGQSDETRTVRVDVIWLDANGSALSEGIPESVGISLSGGGASEERTVSADTGWEASFTVPKYDGEGNEIGYTVSLVSPVTGFSASSSTAGNRTDIIMTKEAAPEPSGGSEPGASSSSGATPGSNGAPSSAGAPSSSGAPSKQPGDSSGSGFAPGDSSGPQSKPGSGKMPGGSSGMGGVSFSGASAGLITEEGATIEDAESENENPYAFAETTLCAFMPNDTVSVDVAVDELDISKIVVGADVQVTLDALPGQAFAGRISAINPFGQNSGGNTKYTVTVEMDKQENMLLGMSASVGIDLEDRANVLVVPEAALVEQDGKTYVYTSFDEAKDELGGLAEVETGIADGTNAEVTSGLEEGQPYYYRYAGTISYVFK